MNKHFKNLAFKYVLIASMAIALVFGQAFKLHMHLEDDDILSATMTENKLNVHVASLLHSTTQESHDHHEPHQPHHGTEVKVSPDSVVKKMESFSLYILLFSFLLFFFAPPRLACVFRRNIQEKLSSGYYLFSPPLRAPPIHFSV